MLEKYNTNPYKKGKLWFRYNEKKYKRKCKCGHSITLNPNYRRDYIICTWCKNRFYKTEEMQEKYEKEKFNKELLKRLKK